MFTTPLLPYSLFDNQLFQYLHTFNIYNFFFSYRRHITNHEIRHLFILILTILSFYISHPPFSAHESHCDYISLSCETFIFWEHVNINHSFRWKRKPVLKIFYIFNLLYPAQINEHVAVGF